MLHSGTNSIIYKEYVIASVAWITDQRELINTLKKQLTELIIPSNTGSSCIIRDCFVVPPRNDIGGYVILNLFQGPTG